MKALPPNLPSRAKLPHISPAWVSPSSLFFITICGTPRGKNQLCHDLTAGVIFESVDFRQRRLDWYVTLLLLMPDHLHMVAAFPRDLAMKTIIRNWKSLLARTTGIRWQRDFFDHRVRNQASLEEKVAYIRQNPVRGGLVGRADDWKYKWEPFDGGPGRSALPS
jgi:putative transposase